MAASSLALPARPSHPLMAASGHAPSSHPLPAGSIVTLIGTSAPQTAFFFLTYLVSRQPRCILDCTCLLTHCWPTWEATGSAVCSCWKQCRCGRARLPLENSFIPSTSRPLTPPQLIGGFLDLACSLYCCVIGAFSRTNRLTYQFTPPNPRSSSAAAWTRPVG